MLMEDADLRVLYIAAEAVPYIKVGGLGDVAGVLPREIKNVSSKNPETPDLDIRLALPLHHQINRDEIDI